MNAPCPRNHHAVAPPRLTPEEDAIGDPAEDDDEIDDLLPADLWFRAPRRALRMHS